MEQISTSFLDMVLYAGWFCVGLSLLLQLTYSMRLVGIRKRTEKYKFATAKEVKSLRRVTGILAVGITFFAFFFIISWIGGRLAIYHYIGAGFFAIVIGIAIGYAFSAYLKYYYPFLLEKRLSKIRFKPMKSVETGNKMRLLTEDEEDVHMTQKMIEEEEAFSADYDVWIDDKTGHKVIEKYDTHYHTLICNECNFRTLKDIKEEIVKQPTRNEEGMLRKQYRCSYCGHQQVKEFKIASWEEEGEMQKIEEATE